MSHCQRVKVKIHNEVVWRRFIRRFTMRSRYEEAEAMREIADACFFAAVCDNENADRHAESARLHIKASKAYLEDGAALFARYMFDTHGGTKHGNVSWPVFSNGYGLAEAEEPAGVQIESEA